MKKALFDSFLWRGIYFLTALILNVGLARVYEASESGWIYFISNNFFLVLLISSLSLDSGMMYFSASKKISNNKLALFSITWPLVVAVSTIVSIFFLAHFNFITANFFFIVVAGCAYTFGVALTNFFTSLFYASHNFSTPNILLSAINIVIVVLMIFQAKKVLPISKDLLLYIYFLQFVLQGVSLAVLYLLLYTKIPALTYPNLQECNVLFRFSLISLSANIAYYLIYRIDYLFVEAYCSTKSLGNYVQVSKTGQLLLILPTIISSAIYPHASAGNNFKVIKLIYRMFAFFLVLYVFILIGSLLWSEAFFKIMFGNTFDEMYVPFLILVPGILFLSLHNIIAAFFGGNNKPLYNLISTGAGLLVVLAGDFLLIKNMGITAAALVSTLGYCTAFMVSFGLFVNRTGSAWKEIFSTDIFRLSTYTSILNPQPSQSK